MSSWKQGERGLLPNEVEYLVFEGGGGKGILYKGAIEALEDRGVIDPIGAIPRRDPGSRPRPTTDDFKPALGDQVKGIAGSSAGAITAVLLGTGFSSKNIGKFLSNTDFTKFLDIPIRHIEPWPGVHEGNRVVRRDELMARKVDEELTRKIKRNQKLGKKAREKISSFKTRREKLITMLSNPLQGASEVGIWTALSSIATTVLGALKAFGQSNFVSQKLLGGGPDRLRRYYQRLSGLFGLFSGAPAREIIDHRLAERVSKIDKVTKSGVDLDRSGSGAVSYRNITFEEYEKVFGVKLALTGSNMTTGSSEVFSWAETPKFPVADAARISMGIPLVFMPVQLLKSPKSSVRTLSMDGETQQRETHSLFESESSWESFSGYWVDGGVLNNMPVRIFDELEGRLTPTLGIRLDVPTQSEIKGAVHFFMRTVVGMLGSSESHISKSWRTESQTVALPTSSVSTLDFGVKPSEVSDEIRKSKSVVNQYFDSATQEALAPQRSPEVRRP